MFSVKKVSLAQPAKMNSKLWIALGVILWLVFVISQIPALWGAWLMTRGGDLALSGVTGSLWKGHASLASIKIEQKDYSLGGLDWQLQPLSLLLLKPCATIQTRIEGQEIDGEVCSGLGGSIQLRNMDLSASAGLFQGVLPLAIDGQIAAHIDELRMDNQTLEKLKGTLSWTAARIHNGNNWMDVGSYGAELTDDAQGGINASIFNLEGPVILQLQAALLAAGGGTVKGTVSMPTGFAQEINAGAWISMFAQEQESDEEGNKRFTVDTNL